MKKIENSMIFLPFGSIGILVLLSGAVLGYRDDVRTAILE